jgi:putative colanic acid biosynthesis glycosyltransferase WcaI
VRIAMLTAHFAPDAAPSAMIATRLADALATRGHDIWVGTAPPSYRPTAELAGPSEPHVSVQRSRPGKDRFRIYANYHVAILGWSAALRKADVILSISPPISLGTLASLVGTGKPTVYNVQDVLAEFLKVTGQLRNGLRLGFLEALERFTYGRTTALVTVGESQRRFLLTQGVPPEKVSTIENFADVDAITPRPVDFDYRRALGIPDWAFCALYAGNFGLVNDLDLLLETVGALSSRKDVMFVFSGGGREWARAVEFARGKTNVVLVGHRPVSELPQLYAAADVGLVTLRRGLSSCSVPSKTYTILASGRPFVAAIDGESDVARIAQQSDGGVAVAPGDVPAFTAAILQLAADRKRAARMGESGYRYVLENNTPDRTAHHYEALFERIANCGIPIRQTDP